MLEMDSRLIAGKILNKLGHEPTNGQVEAIDLISSFITRPDLPRHQFAFMLKGYAGTGKTTLVSALVKVLPMAGMQSVLLAPTGRAAKVLGSYSKKQAFTIHRKIYRSTTGSDGKMSMTLASNPHKYTLFIVDEASMIPGPTASADQGIYSHRDILEDLINYIYNAEGCRLLLIGDAAQLPPVGDEISPALNIEYLKSVYHLDIHSFELNEVVRQSLESGVLSNATDLRKKVNDEKPEFPFFHLNSFTDIKRIDGTDFEDSLNSCYSRFGVENTCIITRSNKRANMFNNEIRERLLFRETELSSGDIIMITKNNYFWLPKSSKAGFIANGDMAEVRRIQKIGEMYGLRFADIAVQLLDYPEEGVIEIKLLLDSMNIASASLPQNEMTKLYDEIMLDFTEVNPVSVRTEKVKNNPFFNAVQAKFAYALTCHKTQGGQWDAVFIDHGYLTDEMIDSSFVKWLYTAITRTAKELYLVNFKSNFFDE
ncbi:MAG: AAA family ATPase [Lentimicrobium sp.]|nr:AAA family ATPase [Lentimicrobium sp.]